MAGRGEYKLRLEHSQLPQLASTACLPMTFIAPGPHDPPDIDIQPVLLHYSLSVLSSSLTREHPNPECLISPRAHLPLGIGMVEQVVASSNYPSTGDCSHRVIPGLIGRRALRTVHVARAYTLTCYLISQPCALTPLRHVFLFPILRCLDVPT